MPPPSVYSRGSMRSLIDTNKRATDWNKDYSQGWRPGRGAYAARGYGRGGRPAPIHRHRSLVLNGNNPTSATLTENILPASGDTETSNGSAPAYVAKTGRHLQLINTSIYEKDTQTRAKAMEETRKQKLKQRDDREKAKLHKHIQRLGGGNIGIASPLPYPATNYEIEVQGIRFRVTKDGSKLAKVAGEISNNAFTGTQGGAHHVQVIVMQRNLRRRWHWSEVSNFTAPRTETCIALVSSKPTGMDDHPTNLARMPAQI